jgi:hypothetical protein
MGMISILRAPPSSAHYSKFGCSMPNPAGLRPVRNAATGGMRAEWATGYRNAATGYCVPLSLRQTQNLVRTQKPVAVLFSP